MKISLRDLTLPRRGALAVGVLADSTLTSTAAELDRASGGAVKRALEASRFTGKKGQYLELLAPHGVHVSRLVLYGLGTAKDLNFLGYEAVGGEIVRRLALSGESDLAVAVDAVKGGAVEAGEAAAHVAYGALLGGYRFDKYRTTMKDDEKPGLASVSILVGDHAASKKIFADLTEVAEGVSFARDLVTEPANVIYPESLAAECRKLTKLGVKVEILGEEAMKKLGMNTLLGVGQGSERESQLVVMQWNGAGGKGAPCAFVGKGVCFDSGGLSLKTASGMEEMKWDMGGAAAVIGLMRALAGRKAKVNAVGVIGLVENMPSGTAQRPGDVVKSMSGQTVEILNTDAEGRLVLADALWYCQDRFHPTFMVNLATLTGAIITALGHEHAGLFSNDDKLADRLLAAGQAEGELLWRFPLSDAYDKNINSDIADVKNIAGPAAGAGSITAAQFLQRFVNKVPWAHLDIAGMAWNSKDRPTSPKGASAFGVRLLDRLVRDHHEGAGKGR
jgi:leucyl aminopeptidase